MVFIHNFDPTLFSIGPLEIRYYGLGYVLGFLVGYYISKHLIKTKNIGMTEEELQDYLLYLAIGMLVGARLFYFVFYNMGMIIDDPLHIFKIWQGGMSFHGGLIGMLTAGYFYCKKYNKDYYTLADMTVIAATPALFMVRIANFINAELYGRVTDVLWAVDFGDGLARHPSQLYEAVKNGVIFTALWKLKDKELRNGTIFWTFVMMYGILRFCIEFVREPDPQLGFVLFNFFTMGQVLTAIMAILGGSILFHWHLKRKP
jgi:phosphatidylglycerol---prolipoprotein diacylglyceryl transferase